MKPVNVCAAFVPLFLLCAFSSCYQGGCPSSENRNYFINAITIVPIGKDSLKPVPKSHFTSVDLIYPVHRNLTSAWKAQRESGDRHSYREQNGTAFRLSTYYPFMSYVFTGPAGRDTVQVTYSMKGTDDCSGNLGLYFYDIKAAYSTCDTLKYTIHPYANPYAETLHPR